MRRYEIKNELLHVNVQKEHSGPIDRNHRQNLNIVKGLNRSLLVLSVNTGERFMSKGSCRLSSRTFRGIKSIPRWRSFPERSASPRVHSFVCKARNCMLAAIRLRYLIHRNRRPRRARPRRFPESPDLRNATGRGNNVGVQ